MKAAMLCVLALVAALALSADAQGPAGPATPAGPAVPPAPGGAAPGGDVAAQPECKCPLPANGGGFFGRGQYFVASGCDCQNACEFRPGPNGPKPSCATVCKCGQVNLQTFNQNRGPLVIPPSNYHGFPMPWGRKLASGEYTFVEY